MTTYEFRRDWHADDPHGWTGGEICRPAPKLAWGDEEGITLFYSSKTGFASVGLWFGTGYHEETIGSTDFGGLVNAACRTGSALGVLDWLLEHPDLIHPELLEQVESIAAAGYVDGRAESAVAA